MNNIVAVIFFLSVVQSIVSLGHYFIYRTLITFTHLTPGPLLVGIRIFFVVASISFLISSLVTQFEYNTFTVWGYRISAVWLGTVYLLFWTSIIAWVIALLGSWLKIDLYTIPFIGILFGCTILLSGYGVINSFSPTIKNLSVRLPNLPEQWKGKRIIFVADTHFGQIRGSAQAKNFAKQIADQHPELVLIAGDFYDGPKTDFLTPAKIFGDIPSTYGTYFVTGNHEEYTAGKAYKTGIEKSRIHDIGDRSVDVNGLQIIGLAYEDNHTEEQIRKHLTDFNIDQKKTSLLIKHVPLHVNVPEEFNISLQLYGHTHNGQSFPNQIFTKLIFKGYNYGLKSVGKNLVYITSGLGTWGPPQRIGTKPEIVVITFE